MKRGQFVKWSSRRFDLKSIFLWGRLPVPDSDGWDLQLEKGITFALFQHYLNQVCLYVLIIMDIGDCGSPHVTLN